MPSRSLLRNLWGNICLCATLKRKQRRHFNSRMDAALQYGQCTASRRLTRQLHEVSPLHARHSVLSEIMEVPSEEGPEGVYIYNFHNFGGHKNHMLLLLTFASYLPKTLNILLRLT